MACKWTPKPMSYPHGYNMPTLWPDCTWKGIETGTKPMFIGVNNQPTPDSYFILNHMIDLSMGHNGLI